MPRRFRFRQVDVFTDRPLAGNPLAIFPDADGLDEEEMQALAREMNLSETTFVLPPTEGGRRAGADYRMRIFTPTLELPFAGHPAIGTAWALAADGRFALEAPATVVRQEVAIGVLPLTLSVSDRDGALHVDEVAMTQGLAEVIHRADPDELEEIAASLEVRPQELGWGPRRTTEWARPAWISTGLPYLVVPVRGLELLADLDVERSADIARVAASYGADSAALVTTGHAGVITDADVHVRVFDDPRTGIIEDPATGSAAGPVAIFLGLLADARARSHRIVIEQGVEAGRPSRLVAEVDFDDDGRPGEVRVSGRTVAVLEGEVTL